MASCRAGQAASHLHKRDGPESVAGVPRSGGSDGAWERGERECGPRGEQDGKGGDKYALGSLRQHTLGESETFSIQDRYQVDGGEGGGFANALGYCDGFGLCCPFFAPVGVERRRESENPGQRASRRRIHVWIS